MNRRERRANARGSQSNRTGSGPGTPAALCETGLGHRRAGRHLDAQLCCQQALAIDSDHPDALHLMGLLSLDARQYDHAAAWISRAIDRDPRPDFLGSLGVMLQQLGRSQEALAAFDQAIEVKSDDAELWKNRGNALIDLQRPSDAVASFQQTITLNPGDWDAAYRCGFLLRELGLFEEALSCFNRVDRLKPNQALVLEMRAATLHGLQQFELAISDNSRAHALNPGSADTCNNIGAALQALRRDAEALPWFDKALKLRPDYIMAMTNKASSLQQLHRFDEAIALYRHAGTIDPDNPEPEWGLALLHLLTGDFAAGWTGREARWRKADRVAYPRFAQPVWLGLGDIANKTLLIHVDEGLGDSLQFVRYVPMAIARGARVILVVLDAVYPLLANFPGVAQCLPLSNRALPPFDLHCPISSLPLAFGTQLDTIPSTTAYLPSPPESRVKAWQDRLDARLAPCDKLRVGLVWSGNPRHTNDHNRSLPLRTLSGILDLDASFVSLQKDPKPDDAATLREWTEILDLTADLTDFSETAALVNCLDLVIAVDTSVAHLAAALGRPTWILLPYTPDYRWLLNRDDSPWYPTVKLFRQTETRDYTVVLDRVRSELAALVHARAAADRTNPNAGTAAALSAAGWHHLRAGRSHEAQICCQQALAREPDHPDALHLTGLLSLHTKHYDEAVEWISRAIRREPRPEFLSSLGTALRQQGRLEEALQVCDKAVQLRPDDAELWKNLGNTLVGLKRLPDALLSYQQALKLNPRYWEAASGSGVVLHELRRFEEALTYFDLSDEVQPNQLATISMRAILLRKVKRFEESLAQARRAHDLDPRNTSTLNDIGDVLQSLGRSEEALQWLDRALATRPDLVEALSNKAIALGQLRRFDEAFAIYDRLKLLSPDNPVTAWNSALLHMLTGDFEAGWAGREARWRIRSLSEGYPKFPEPMWLGQQDIEGKTILICADEGLGDAIQFARYVPMVAARGARVILVVEGSVRSLLAGLPGVSLCLPKSPVALPPFDMHCPMSSLPLAFAARLDNIPFGAYLPAPAAARVQVWEDRLVERLGARRKLRVGLVWSGNPIHRNDHNRSLPLQALSRLLDLDADFVSLQKNPRPDDQATLLAHGDIVDPTVDLTDFSETAALVSCLDLVITVDTSVAHLAAALGRPTWILLPYTPDYRWLLDRNDSPWYPTVKLFRQTETRDYAPILDRIRTALADLISA